LSQQRLRPVEFLDPARHDHEAFDSGARELDDWLRHTAVVAAAAGTAATWILRRGDRVVGYYALAMGGVEHRGAPSRLRRGHPDPIPVLILTRLAIDRSEQGRGLGADLLRDALIRAVVGARQYGARAIIVDAIDDRAFAFYRHHGFLLLSGQRLYRRITDIQRSVQPTSDGCGLFLGLSSGPQA
jgi:predicted N-acetyltransferase YhbS